VGLIFHKLLQKNPKERLGNKGADEVKKHKWFANIDWDLLAEKKVMRIEGF